MKEGNCSLGKLPSSIFRTSNLLSLTYAIKRSFFPRKILLVSKIEATHKNSIWTEPARRSLLIAVIRFFCKKKSRRLSSKNIFRSHSSDRLSSLIRNLIFSGLKNERGVRGEFRFSLQIFYQLIFPFDYKVRPTNRPC